MIGATDFAAKLRADANWLDANKANLNTMFARAKAAAMVIELHALASSIDGTPARSPYEFVRSGNDRRAVPR